MSYRSLKSRKLKPEELSEAYHLYKALLGPYIHEVYGWDESFQAKRFSTTYKLDQFFWYIQEDEKKVLVCKNVSDDYCHLHLFLVPKKYQSQGVGKNVMFALQNETFSQSQVITLSSFKCNSIACDFYRSLGYTIIKDDDDFFTFALSNE